MALNVPSGLGVFVASCRLNTQQPSPLFNHSSLKKLKTSTGLDFAAFSVALFITSKRLCHEKVYPLRTADRNGQWLRHRTVCIESLIQETGKEISLIKEPQQGTNDHTQRHYPVPGETAPVTTHNRYCTATERKRISLRDFDCDLRPMGRDPFLSGLTPGKRATVHTLTGAPASLFYPPASRILSIDQSLLSTITPRIDATVLPLSIHPLHPLLTGVALYRQPDRSPKPFL